MRTSQNLYLIAAAATLISFAAPIVPAAADPSYTAGNLITIFAKDKAAADAAKKVRGLCFESDPDCPKPTLVDLQVNFEFDSNRLTGQAKENLDQVAIALKAPEILGTRFNVEGHTDAKGNDQYNQFLSERRAKAVVDYLVAHGIEADTLQAKGFGKTRPKVRDPYSPVNRRVEGHVAG
jgi:outer membrane protein OmpA-like peptidoglycan-associated protein